MENLIYAQQAPTRVFLISNDNQKYGYFNHILPIVYKTIEDAKAAIKGLQPEFKDSIYKVVQFESTGVAEVVELQPEPVTPLTPFITTETAY